MHGIWLVDESQEFISYFGKLLALHAVSEDANPFYVYAYDGEDDTGTLLAMAAGLEDSPDHMRCIVGYNRLYIKLSGTGKAYVEIDDPEAWRKEAIPYGQIGGSPT